MEVLPVHACISVWAPDRERSHQPVLATRAAVRLLPALPPPRTFQSFRKAIKSQRVVDTTATCIAAVAMQCQGERRLGPRHARCNTGGRVVQGSVAASSLRLTGGRGRVLLPVTREVPKLRCDLSRPFEAHLNVFTSCMHMGA